MNALFRPDTGSFCETNCINVPVDFIFLPKGYGWSADDALPKQTSKLVDIIGLHTWTISQEIVSDF